MKISITCLLGLFTGVVYSQSTFSEVHSIFQTSCGTSCHAGGSPAGQLDLSGDETAMYNALINVDPVNPTALNKNDKLVYPGHPSRSFVLRKCENDLDSGEGNIMPPAGALNPEEVALIENWILFGAPETGEVVNYSTIQNYYNGQGLSQTVTPPTPPAEGEGIQVHMGSIYLEPQEEVEYFIKQDFNFGSDTEVIGLDMHMNSSSHHFLLYKFDEGEADGYSEGLRLLGTEDSDNSTSLVVAWQFDNSVTLPEGTAYKWEAGTVLDFNYHVVNYSTDSILKAELYLNILTQESGIAEHEMFSDLILYPPFSFYVPADGQDYTFTDAYYQANSNLQLNVWMLSSHTHKYGTDYDIFLRNSDGSTGEQVYEGFYNVDYTFNQGYYDWEHPAIRYFEPFLEVPLKDGLIHTATYNNYGDEPAYFNVTTEDEMMLFFIQYTAEMLSGIEENDQNLNIFPNPLANDQPLIISSDQDQLVQLQVHDITGKLIYQENNYSIQKGQHAFNGLTGLGLNSGTYFVHLLNEGKNVTIKLVIE